MQKINKFFLNLYKNTASLILRLLFGKGCRFTPTCSEYASEAILEHGFFKGSLLSFRRILKCNPFGGWGEDPVPTK